MNRQRNSKVTPCVKYCISTSKSIKRKGNITEGNIRILFATKPVK